ncbi:MAG TPA: IPT/TIG domain-containing protein, partial [Bryobacteraceae bacterium]|nr:IPT/TIG domain-containing protein [Bryobacteraceae bacterium]
NGLPSITSLNPSSAVPGSPAFTLTVQGSNFASGSTALWNGQALATTVVSATQLTAQVPAALIASPGTVSVTVAAADGVASNALPFTLTLPRLTGVGVTAPSSSTSGQNQPVTVNLGSGYPVDLLGTLTLTFAPQGNLPDDPSIQFQNGSRVFTFTIPAGNSPAPVQVMVSTGTVAGTITITSTFTASGTDVTPAGIAPEIIQIAPAVPSLSQPTCTASASGFTFSVGGYSNTRDVSQANFSFQPASGASLGTTQLTIAVTPIFSSWFGGSASAGDGGEFQYTQPFTIQGSLSTIGTVTVTLVNSAGTSAPVSCQMP